MDSRIRGAWLAACAGVVLAVLMGAVGYALASQGTLTTSPFGPVGQIALDVTLGIVLGYYLGASLRPSASDERTFVFLSALFGSFVIGVAVLSVSGNIRTSGIEPWISLTILCSATAFPALFVGSGMVDAKGLKLLKEGLFAFSGRLSAAVLAGYSTASLWGQGAGIVVAVVLTVCIAIYSTFRGDIKGMLSPVTLGNAPVGASTRPPPGVTGGPPRSRPPDER